MAEEEKSENSMREYLAEGTRKFNPRQAMVEYREFVASLNISAALLGVSLDIITHENEDGVTVAWSIVDSVPCISCHERIKVGDAYVEVRKFTGLPREYMPGMQVMHEMLGFKHLRCVTEVAQYNYFTTPVHGM